MLTHQILFQSLLHLLLQLPADTLKNIVFTDYIIFQVTETGHSERQEDHRVVVYQIRPSSVSVFCEVQCKEFHNMQIVLDMSRSVTPSVKLWTLRSTQFTEFTATLQTEFLGPLKHTLIRTLA